jgi:hypothetical protein
MGSDPEATELLEQVGPDGVERNSGNRYRGQTVQWLRSLDFGFFELDCLLIHGSTVGCHDVLTPETPPMQLLDRLLRADANYLVLWKIWVNVSPANSGRGGDLYRDNVRCPGSDNDADKCAIGRVVGVGSVGKEPGQGNLYAV